MSYVYIRSEPNLWTVGFYDPKGTWHPDSDHTDSEKAAKRVAWLNGRAALDDVSLRGLDDIQASFP
jgi:hypothetical protein